MIIHAARLHETIVDHGIPIVGIDCAGQVQPTNMQLLAQPIIDAFDDSDTAEAAWQNLSSRVAAKVGFGMDTSPHAKTARAVASLLIDELNASRGWIMAFKAELAVATTLAGLKTRVAALPNLPDRTFVQAKTAFANKIDGGTVD